MTSKLPIGLAGIVNQFGDPGEYVNRKTEWEAITLGVYNLRTPLIWAYDQKKSVLRIRAHHLIVTHLGETIQACLDAGVPRERMKYGGCYSWRAKRRNGGELSTHTWGIAIDLEPAENPPGKNSRLDSRIPAIFKDRGWNWGADFNDPMHFQWAAKY